MISSILTNGEFLISIIDDTGDAKKFGQFM